MIGDELLVSTNNELIPDEVINISYKTMQGNPNLSTALYSLCTTKDCVTYSMFSKMFF